jgi:hypothetical protein
MAEDFRRREALRTQKVRPGPAALFGFVRCDATLMRQLAQGDSEVACGSLKTVGARFQLIYVRRRADGHRRASAFNLRG